MVTRAIVILAVILTFIDRCRGDDPKGWPSRLDATSLRELPRVHSITIHYAAAAATRRIVHICDFPAVLRYDFEQWTQKTDAATSTEKIDSEYKRLTELAAAVQDDQLVLLRALLKRHDVKTVYLEGQPNVGGLLDILCAIRDIELDKDAPVDNIDFASVSDEEAYLRSYLRRHETGRPENDTTAWRLRFGLGAAGRLFLSGELSEIRGVEPTDSHGKQLWRLRAPIGPADYVFRGASIERDEVWTASQVQREDGITKSLINGDRVAVVILSTAHDLSDNVRRLSKGTCEYIRIETMAVGKNKDEINRLRLR